MQLKKTVDIETLCIADMNHHRVLHWGQNATQGDVVAGGKWSGKRIGQLDSPVAVLIDRMNQTQIISDCLSTNGSKMLMAEK